MWAEIGHHLLCIYVSCRYEIHEDRADIPSVRIRPHIYTLSIRVLNKNKLTSLYPETFFPPFYSLSLAIPQTAFLCFREAPLIHPPISFHKAAWRHWGYCNNVETGATVWGSSYEKKCAYLHLTDQNLTEWQLCEGKESSFISIRALFKNILWGQQQRQAPCSWHLQSCYAKPPAPSCSPTHLYPAASQASSQQHTLPARLPWDNSPQQISSHNR